MIVALDVGYSGPDGQETGTCGVVCFSDWGDHKASFEATSTTAVSEPYEPGKLFLRELPCLLDGLAQHEQHFNKPPDLIVVDGNVRLGPTGRPGLGKILYDQLNRTVPVVGVAKNSYAGLDAQIILRGQSTKELYVTAAGIDEKAAAQHIIDMAGDYRIPDLLRRADQLSRQHL